MMGAIMKNFPQKFQSVDQWNAVDICILNKAFDKIDHSELTNAQV